MSASSFTDWQIACDHPGCDSLQWASEAELPEATATGLRKFLKPRGWVVNVAADDGSRKRRDYCPRHNPDLAIRIRAVLEHGGWAAFGSRVEDGRAILSAPGEAGEEGSWRPLVTEQCARYLHESGFETRIADGYLYVSEG